MIATLRRHIWTDQERDVLRALYVDYSAAECAAAIGCSVSAVNNQAHALGLDRVVDAARGVK